ncbi:MAG: nuclear transport factor 2 family protein [Ferruginibacter sp.]
MKRFLILVSFLAACHSSNNAVDIEAEKKAILAIHEDQRKAHIGKDISLLLRDSSTDYIEVNRGLIKKPTYAENYKRFKSYFDEVDFVKWDDASPPVISFSDDATMATSVVDKLVITRHRAGNNQLDTTHYAWLAVFKKINGKWQLHRMGSTNN